MKRKTFTWTWIGVAISLLLRITNTRCPIMSCRYLSTRTILFPSTTCHSASGPLLPILPYTIHCIIDIEQHYDRHYDIHTIALIDLNNNDKVNVIKFHTQVTAVIAAGSGKQVYVHVLQHCCTLSVAMSLHNS